MKRILLTAAILILSGTVPDKPKLKTTTICPTPNPADCYQVKQAVAP